MKGCLVRAGFFAVALLLLAPGSDRPTLGAEDFGLKVAPGFRVRLYADQDLANDTYAMTLDAKGRVVVTTAGSVSTLHDDDGDGRADRSVEYARTATGGMGLCFDGDDLLFCGDGWLSRHRDADGDGRADGPPERLVPLAFAEHGGHAMRKGPDGCWYVIGGNDAGIDGRHVTLATSPVRRPEAGALLRLPPDLKGCEVVAHGFRNPYDFDFNARGDLFTYDSDCERDYFLPWYTPTRLYLVAVGGHHGWRLNGFTRSWCRPDDYLDTVDILQRVGRGSPTGVVCYRHHAFPARYRGGVFIQDWTFGRVLFYPLDEDGTSYRTAPEVFLEPIGTQGFAPTDLAVAPDGSLLVSIGGRKTRGAVYRVEFPGPVEPSPPARTERDAVLDAPQPLDAWSRARWEPIARRLGPGPFEAAVVDDSEPESARVRAVEVLTELFGGLSEPTIRAGADIGAPEGVRARVAWSLGRAPRPWSGVTLLGLAGDPHPRVRLAALESLAIRPDGLDARELRRILSANLADADKRVRQAAARLASLLPERAWSPLIDALESAPPQARLTGALATLWRSADGDSPDRAIRAALGAIERRSDPDLTFQAVRLVMLALGDYALNNPPVEVYTGYALARPLTGREDLARSALVALRPRFPSGRERLDAELARLLAMLGDDDPETPRKFAAFWTPESSATSDLHYLIAFARLKGPKESLSGSVADALLSLDRKLQGQELRTKQSWNDRLVELTADLTRQMPGLADRLLEHPDLVRPAHVALALALDPPHAEGAARRFLERVRTDPEFEWSGPLVQLLGRLGPDRVRPLLRDQWSQYGLRDAILPHLADQPEECDRTRFLDALDSSQPETIRTALGALERLPRDPEPGHLIPLLRLLRRLIGDPKQADLRRAVIALIGRQSGDPIEVTEAGTDPASLGRAYRPLFEGFERRSPALAKALDDTAEGDPEALAKLLRSVDWSSGRADRGAKIFRDRACQTCHAGARALGPDLTGVAGRLAREDLFAAIALPSRDVSPLYRTTMIETRDGQVHTGMIAFESADGVIMQTGAATTLRIASEDIAARRPSDRSLMPAGLLKDLTPGDLADLDKFLHTLDRGPSPGPGR